MSEGLIKFTPKQLKALMNKVTKRTFDRRVYVESTKKWWQLYTLAAMTGIVKDDRIEEISGVRKNVQKLIFDTYFSNVNCHGSYWSMSRGERQSFTYKCRRFEENVTNFIHADVYHAHWRVNDARTNHRKQLGIKCLYSISVNHTRVGAVIAMDTEHAAQLANMFIVPLLPDGLRENTLDTSSARLIYPVWKDREMKDYINTSAMISSHIKETISGLKDRQNEISREIETNNLIIKAIQSNLMVQLDVTT